MTKTHATIAAALVLATATGAARSAGDREYNGGMTRSLTVCVRQLALTEMERCFLHATH